MTARTTLSLPDGFRPESLALGAEPVAYFGSLADGSILAVDLLDGTGRTVSPACGGQAGGLWLDGRGRLFVAGCFHGDARVVDVRTGEVLASYRLTDAQPALVADVVVTGDAAWFTDSFNPVLYRLPLGADGELPAQDAVERIPLSGDFPHVEGFNASGITTTPDSSALLVVHSGTGELFRVDPATGAATRVELAGSRLPSGDGMARTGTTLHVALGRENSVAVVQLDTSGTNGVVLERISSNDFDVPTAVAVHGDRLVVVNSRITTEPKSTTPYTALVFHRGQEGSRPMTARRLDSVLDPSQLFHTGLVVADLEEAQEKLSHLFGYSWTTVMELDVTARTKDGLQRAKQRFVLSVEEPRLELVEEIPGTVWVSNGANGAHHVGYWAEAEEIEKISSALVELGLEVEATNDVEQDGVTLWSYHRGLGGIRIELLSTLMRPSMEAWIAGTDPALLADGPL
ncbi:VOC family protein [Lentzea cavernae]|uniref:VOC domain-containing protein n=1 Tax=Lentzea cavernae TaxID=2020703 RepID=A0ABQ3MQK6_9PSEU|nr:VOC family protein [Lentzea cavernae]GHH52470.1 hypothetical protein GCM10017774_64410 [Lentzea cavernae]